MHTRHIVIDFEMNPVAKAHRDIRERLMREIIEIGAVKLDDACAQTDRFHCYVKPQYNSDISAFITGLTGISKLDIYNAQPLETALQQLEAWIGYDVSATVYSWSNNDWRQLQMECECKGVAYPNNLKQWADLQEIYMRSIGLDAPEDHRMSLHTAAAQFGILMDDNHRHSALYDAEIASRLLAPSMNGDSERQVKLLHSTVKETAAPTVTTIGDSCGDVLQQLLLQLQADAEAPEV